VFAFQSGASHAAPGSSSHTAGSPVEPLSSAVVSAVVVSVAVVSASVVSASVVSASVSEVVAVVVVIVALAVIVSVVGSAVSVSWSVSESESPIGSTSSAHAGRERAPRRGRNAPTRAQRVEEVERTVFMDVWGRPCHK
jgi:hypothetical protein